MIIKHRFLTKDYYQSTLLWSYDSFTQGLKMYQVYNNIQYCQSTLLVEGGGQILLILSIDLLHISDFILKLFIFIPILHKSFPLWGTKWYPV